MGVQVQGFLSVLRSGKISLISACYLNWAEIHNQSIINILYLLLLWHGVCGRIHLNNNDTPFSV